MMKVLNVIPNLASRNGGPAVTVVESALALRDLGVEASVFGTDLSESANAPNHGRVAASDLPSGADALDVRLFPARWPYRLAFSPALHRALVEQAGEYDVVHIH